MRKVITRVSGLSDEKIRSTKVSNISPQVDINTEYFRNFITDKLDDSLTNVLSIYLGRYNMYDLNATMVYLRIKLHQIVVLNRFFIYPIECYHIGHSKDPFNSIKYYIDSADIDIMLMDMKKGDISFKPKSKPKYIILPEKMNYNNLINKEDSIVGIDFSGKILPIYSLISFPKFKEILSALEDMTFYTSTNGEDIEFDESCLWKIRNLGLDQYTKCKYKDPSKKVVDVGIDLNIAL